MKRLLICALVVGLAIGLAIGVWRARHRPTPKPVASPIPCFDPPTQLIRQGQEALRTGDWLVAWLYCYEELRQRGGALPPLDCGVDDPQLCVPPADRLRVCAQICVGQALALQRRVEGR